MVYRRRKRASLGAASGASGVCPTTFSAEHHRVIRQRGRGNQVRTANFAETDNPTVTEVLDEVLGLLKEQAHKAEPSMIRKQLSD